MCMYIYTHIYIYIYIYWVCLAGLHCRRHLQMEAGTSECIISSDFVSWLTECSQNYTQSRRITLCSVKGVTTQRLAAFALCNMHLCEVGLHLTISFGENLINVVQCNKSWKVCTACGTCCMLLRGLHIIVSRILGHLVRFTCALAAEVIKTTI